jgi:sRNA-binding carbon storage regulator CsrA
MLALTRTPGEYLVLTIGNTTVRIGVVSVTSSKGKLPAAKVRLCIDSPQHVRELPRKVSLRQVGSLVDAAVDP